MESQIKPVICILNPDDIRYMNEREYSEALENCKTPFDIVAMQEQGYCFPAIKENVVYMLNPLKKKEYIYRTENTDENAIAVRINKIELILSLLGGKNFNVISKSSAKTHDMTAVKVDAEVFVGEKENPNIQVVNKTNIDKEKEGQTDTIITDCVKWNGKYTIKGYKKAIEIAEQYGLDQESDINSILLQRDPKHPNPINSKHYSVHTHSDLASNLQVAEKLQVLIKNKVGVDIDVNVKTSHAQTETSTFDFVVEFGPVRKNWIWWVVLGGIGIIGGLLALAFMI